MSEPLVEKVEFELSRPLSVHEKGALTEIKFLLLKPPSARNRAQTGRIKQAFYRAMGDMQSKFSDQQKTKAQEESQASDATINVEMKGTEIVQMILMSNVDFVDFVDWFRQLLIADCCYLGDGNEKLTNSIYEQLPDNDVDALMALYLENFIFGSLNKD